MWRRAWLGREEAHSDRTNVVDTPKKVHIYLSTLAGRTVPDAVLARVLSRSAAGLGRA